MWHHVAIGASIWLVLFLAVLCFVRVGASRDAEIPSPPPTRRP